MSNFAIKGHATRGKEVIELLEMMGGNNKYDITYTEDNLWYCLRSKDNVIIATYPNSSIKTVLSIEEFLEKFPYKLNELVLCDNGLLGIITKMEWDCEKSDMRYHISFNTSVYNKWYYSKNIKCEFMAEKYKKLAIKGHPTRGKEVIEILEMLGGNNQNNVYSGKDTFHYYFIDNETDYIRTKLYTDDCWTKLTYNIFTLEEFLEKFPYKVGDKVVYTSEVFPIIGMKWDCCRDIVIYTMKTNCGIIDCYDSTWMKPYKEEIPEKIKIDIPNGYEFAGVDDDNQQVVFEKIGCQYPKTFIEVLNFWHPDRQIEDDYQRCYKKDIIEKFQDLLYARDAYWKIAGEQMGLGKPWEPDWNNLSTTHEFIKINKGCFTYSSRVLVFPTEEMRDTFYDNFKELIESCKELL